VGRWWLILLLVACAKDKPRLPPVGETITPPRQEKARLRAEYCVDSPALVERAYREAGWNDVSVQKHEAIPGRWVVTGRRGAEVLSGSLTEGGCAGGSKLDVGVSPEPVPVPRRMAGGAQPDRGRLPTVVEPAR
jgi:hypothetical protein